VLAALAVFEIARIEFFFVEDTHLSQIAVDHPNQV